MGDRICRAPGCLTPVPDTRRARLCGAHKWRLRTYGSFELPARTPNNALRCEAPGCSEFRRRDQWCGMHFARMRSRGTTERLTLEDRFWSKVDKNGPVPSHRPELGPCWVWTKSTKVFGYGQISLGGRGAGVAIAHRLSWELHCGAPPPEDLQVLHRCDVPRCVRPDHLFLGTAADNIADMISKGRQGRYVRTVEQYGNAKLTPAEVVEIRRRAAAGEPYKTIAPDYGVHLGTVGRIVRREGWQAVA